MLLTDEPKLLCSACGSGAVVHTKFPEDIFHMPLDRTLGDLFRFSDSGRTESYKNRTSNIDWRVKRHSYQAGNISVGNSFSCQITRYACTRSNRTHRYGCSFTPMHSLSKIRVTPFDTAQIFFISIKRTFEIRLNYRLPP